MSILNYDGNLVIWSPLEYHEETFTKAVNLLVGEGSSYQVKYVIAINNEHNLYAHQYKEKFGAKIIACDKAKLKNNVEVDHKVTESLLDMVIRGDLWQEKLGISDYYFKDNLEMICMKSHVTNDVELFEKNTHTLYVGDLIINLGAPGTTTGQVELEQYSEATGYYKGYNPHGWLSFPTRYLQPRSAVGSYLANYFAQTKSPEGAESIRTICQWDFSKIVVTHGNVIEKEGKDDFKKLFSSVFT
ncbi:uncharacterized protein SPAPADRAFT_61287 [Spathaspora passalidarum NRRL Y-27907]|uniref:Metallo-beta-lactamase domain-containing protein n=1 Tax=Spathaspora passalidarum (strain NRRL Y-27907 / 11-Y1) TaxID=619300 RepID=G3APN3_SPAPN|nr:uncharacterized protein SPAPADRAFT_61287 [Spathaspora passalidarum NRRL Y-27907]EGW32204.1 hypothetical protein SPAPADRAFT_61287 [Spathaspora passalidarum NRRL Y-27907]